MVGGGDSAMEEAIFLTKFASKVTIVHRRDELRASKIMQERAKSNPKIEFIWNTVVDRINSDNGVVTGVTLRDVKDGSTREFRTDGVFVAIGHTPNTKFLEGQVEMDEQGYIITRNGTQTSVPGVFAAGDVRAESMKRVASAVGDGAMAVALVHRYLEQA